METLAGRHQEKNMMQQLLKSERSEFLAMYGRRRIGKTFLIRSVYKHHIAIEITGMASTETKTQLQRFSKTLQQVYPKATQINNWLDAFEQLKDYLLKNKSQKKVVFFDELPWLDTHKSKFLSCLDHFWNNWASARTDIVLVVCGSAASWMINKLINNKGGLHNRITARILLQPFTLAETAHYFALRKLTLNPFQITQLYMVLGGIPFYLNEVKKGMSAAQVIDKLCFASQGLLKDEYDNLFRSLFTNSQQHSAIVEALASKQTGLTRDEVIRKSGLANGGTLTMMLHELETCGFITRTMPFGKKMRESLYRLTDAYTLFYLKFIRYKKNSGKGTWLSKINSPAYNAWSGYAFENVCMAHTQQLKQSLGIAGVYTEQSSWRGSTEQTGAQIDLVLDRKDHVINLCEFKFSEYPFTITKKYAAELRNKLAVFKASTKTRKTLFLTFITINGLAINEHSLGLVQQELSMNALFSQ